ncbi:MAG: LPS assembly lipoprotein LptE [Candidatus Sumerlaeia bacterium]|nr:LPS assembly lipoprotein LptE [Candidatus Sumerlaeia bacterium]
MKRTFFVFAVVAVAMAAACTRIPPVRILPTHINSIYIVTFENRSYEPGIEEKLTKLTQEEFLLDGRLTVTTRPNADAILAGKIQYYNVLSGRLGTDDFPLSSEIEVVADVSLYDPSDRKREKPLMTWQNIDARYSYVSDARRIIQMSAEDASEEALRSLARQIVFAVITQRPTKVAPGVLTASGPAPPGTPQRIPGAKTLDTRFLDTVTTTTDLAPETEPAKSRK